MFWIQLAITGLATGCIYALAGLGLVLTYKATGVFNFAHGAIGVAVAYALYQLNTLWHIPIGVAAPLALLVVGPGLGLLLERFVFRPLARRGATTSEKLVASLGVFVLMFGLVFTIYTGESRVGPQLIPARPFTLPGSYIMSWDQVGNIAVTALISAGLWALFRFTHLGTEIRAVVDRPELAELASINANRVAGIAWAMGAGLAGLSGVLFAQGVLEPLKLTLFLLETFSLAVVARLTSIPIAVGAGALMLGVGKAWVEQGVHLFSSSSVAGKTVELMKPNLSALLLLVALLVYRRLDTVGEAAERPTTGVVRRDRAGTRPVGLIAVAAALLVLPAFLDDNGFDAAHRFLAFSVIFVSIVAVTGFSGQITLGQAGFAGLGAFSAARFANEFHTPVLVAMLFGGLVAAAAGFIAGWPALRRRGLFLALTTLAFGLLIYYVVINNPTLAGDARGLDVTRPSLFGWSLEGPVAFYYFELVVAALMLGFARNLRSGRLGRALAAMRDSEAGARSVGIDLRAYKLFIFSISAFIAGIGGALLTQQAKTFDDLPFHPLQSLFWFAVVVVAGVYGISGAVLGGFVWVMLDRLLNVDGLAQLIIGAGALSLGTLPGGSLTGLARVASERFALATRRALADAKVSAAPHPAPPALEPTPYARHLLADPPAAGAAPPPAQPIVDITLEGASS